MQGLDPSEAIGAKEALGLVARLGAHHRLRNDGPARGPSRLAGFMAAMTVCLQNCLEHVVALVVKVLDAGANLR